ncbi:NUDIX domain-containing protein [Streptomyces roseoverticillatus]|uniref:NUDIX hydrolase n=1 Tax=Streptomyces roseoverticillatus TaxID=66429 RepID=UPI0033F2B8FC
MSIDSHQIRIALDAFLRRHPKDGQRLDRVREILDLAGASPASRKEFRGHVTAGAVLTDDRDRVLRIHHRGLNTWLFPGGHVEAGDSGLVAAALRELREETGVTPESVTVVDEVPVDIDIHTIPENPAKGEPEHPHFDFRYLLRTCSPVLALQREEVTDARWCPVQDVTARRLRERIQAALDHPVDSVRR